MTDPSFKALQNWLHSLITTRGNFNQKVFLTEAQHQLNAQNIVAERRDVDIYSRLHVYTSGYVLRLLECLKADYPLMEKFMTASAFEHFAKAYIQYKPSTSYTLFDLGGGFPDFLAATRPKNVPKEQALMFDFPYALALYERTCLEVLRAKGMEGKSKNINTDFFANTLFEVQTVQVTPCLRCLELQFPILEFVRALKKEETVEIPPYQETYIALTRENFYLKAFTLEPWQFHFLQAAQEPITTNEAITIAAAKTNLSKGKLLADLLFFLPMAYENNLLMKN